MSAQYEVRFTRSAKRALTEKLPESVASAAFRFIMGALRDNPTRLGKQLDEPLFPLYSARRGEYRILYRIEDDRLIIEVLSVIHRRDAYRA
ncbi:type II toxin-antitoxin system RelE/ParE family toxin [Herbiconiux sp. CPCC 205763]|uniref:Type II toxin-antitoxin system RelE/ParE family toxin n=1 Tax=Herbiconiux aconitum TaxID=2970913 RepID=A0ABT2GQH5_9MICO|nr:type II toxin-antitoxin system RelE/ParE family toxin [Herbiconiux aconitum]MCS5718475.1 type II toxin-antitoxin system RelE/ParE family toxin [Herbiconiux aconitum]